MALCVAEMDAIIEASARTGRIAAEAFMALHHPQNRRAIEIAQSGELAHSSWSAERSRSCSSTPGTRGSIPGWAAARSGTSGSIRSTWPGRSPAKSRTASHAMARFDDDGVDRMFIGELHFPGGLLAHFDSGFTAADRERLEIVGSAGRLVLDAPFLAEPDGPPPASPTGAARPRHGSTSPAVDQYALEVDDLVGAILDGSAHGCRWRSRAAGSLRSWRWTRPPAATRAANARAT